MVARSCMILCLCGLTVSPVCGQEWARKMFQGTSHNFGDIARDAKAEHAFTFENIYMEDVHIASVRSSCGCTKPRIGKEWVKTYEQGSIIAAINSKAFRGNRSATVTVTIDKPFYAQVRLNVRVNIRSDVVFSPGSVQFPSLEKGQASEKTVQVSHTGRGDWKITELKSVNPHLTGVFKERQRSGGRVVYDLTVRLNKDAPIGYIQNQLMLVTNDRSRPQVPILVEGRVCSSLTVSPNSLFMGVVKPGDKVTKRLVIRGKKPFKIVSIACKDRFFEFGKIPDEAKVIHLIPVTFIAGPSGGKVAQTIRIETDLEEDTPELAAYAVVSNP